MKKQKLLGNSTEGQIIIISAPAGTGKTTLVTMIKKEFPTVVQSISYTTRAPRARETEGENYFFITKEKFEAKIAANEFLEYAEVFGNYYGTEKEKIFSSKKQGKTVLLVIDTQGADLLKNYGFTSIFISPPSIEELRFRLHKRKTETEQMIQMRLKWAQSEMKMIEKYSYHIINDDLQIAYDVLKSILIAEEHRVKIPKGIYEKY